MENQISLEYERSRFMEKSDQYFDYNNSQTLDEESVRFLQLPFDLQRYVVEKFEYQQYARFEQTSQLAHSICSSSVFSVPYKTVVFVNKKTKCDGERRISWNVVSRPPVQVLASNVLINSRLTTGRIRKVTNLFEKNRTKVVHLMFWESINWSVEDLDRLIRVTNSKFTSFHQFLPRQYFTCPSLQNVSFLKFENTTGCTDEELTLLKSDTISLSSDFITSKGLNTILTQWKRRERDINYITVRFGSHLDQISRDDVLQGIESELIWSLDSHEDSILHAIPLEEQDVLSKGEYIYSIWIPDDPEKTLFVYIGKICVTVWKKVGESEFSLQMLKFDHCYTVRNECQICLSEFCEHRN